MQKLFDETYASNGKTSRNIWYSELELSKEGEYGSLVYLSEDLQQDIVVTLKEDLNEVPANSETNWYFYDAKTNEDALGDTPRASLMIKYRNGIFIVHLNFSDHNFAIHLDKILEEKSQLEKKLLLDN